LKVNIRSIRLQCIYLQEEYFISGKGVGSLVTCELYTVIGIRWTFRLYGMISLALLVVYMIVNTIFINSKAESRKEVIFLKEESK
jgi:hypothetical protein